MCGSEPVESGCGRHRGVRACIGETDFHFTQETVQGIDLPGDSCNLGEFGAVAGFAGLLAISKAILSASPLVSGAYFSWNRSSPWPQSATNVARPRRRGDRITMLFAALHES
jgi:hypothetical protein